MPSDIIAPELLSISFSDTSINIGGGENSFVVTARLTDNLSGVNSDGGNFVRFVSPGGQIVDAIFARVSGNQLDGVYHATVTLGPFAEAGTWNVDWGTITDEAGNIKWLQPADSALLQNTTFKVEGSGSDATPPKLESFEIGTPNLNTDGTSEITITARLTDNFSGVNSDGGNFVRFVSPGGQIVDAIFGRVSGNQLDGVYHATVTLSPFAEAGTWNVDWGTITDEAGNIKWLYPTTTPELATATIILGSALSDTMDGTPSADAIFSYSGDDSLRGLDGDDTMVGGDGDDVVDGGLGDDEIVGGDGAGDDKYVGGKGLDTVVYKSATKSISVDLKKGEASGPKIGTDKLKQIEGILGGQAGDTIKGDKGKNILDGFTGNDKLIGRAGNDAFVFSTELGKKNVDSIRDFRPKDDIFHIDDAVFSGLAMGKLSASAFHVGSHAEDGKDRVIYDDQKGLLLFDQNGVKKGGEVVFATLDDGLTIAHKDFLVI
jgi:Ca2+-binding RTX toxin-like protein